MTADLPIQAFVFGLLSGTSLLLGALLAIVWKVEKRAVAGTMAFGAGALIAAATLDLVSAALQRHQFYSLAIGCLLGGLLFVFLNEAINNRGGFLRKWSTTAHFLTRKKSERYRSLLEKISRIELFRQVSPTEMRALLPHLSRRKYAQGTVIIRQGDPGDRLFIIELGTIDILDVKEGPKKITTLKENDIFGEIALLTGEARSASAVAASDCQLYVLPKEHFDRLLHDSPRLAQAVKTLAAQRIGILHRMSVIDEEQAKRWVHEAMKAVEEVIHAPTEADIQEAAREHGNAPLAIWLGALLDGLPESVVIGSSLLHTSLSLSLLGGVFLSNLPESLSSAAGMRTRGDSRVKILVMWGSLMVFAGMGAYLGNLFLAGAPSFLFTFLEGLGAGAMLTMIAQTLLPEAFEKGATLSGFCTLLGFLSAVWLKTLEFHGPPS